MAPVGQVQGTGPILVAPSIVSQVEGHTPVLAASGQLAVDVSDFQTDKTQIWIPNLNTGFKVSQAVANGRYEFILVEMDVDGVAKISDWLEIDGKTEQERFRIKSYRHKATEQDIN